MAIMSRRSWALSKLQSAGLSHASSPQNGAFYTATYCRVTYYRTLTVNPVPEFESTDQFMGRKLAGHINSSPSLLKTQFVFGLGLSV